MRYISALTSLMMLFCVLATQHAFAFQQQNIGGSAAEANQANSGKQTNENTPLQELVGSSSTPSRNSTSEGQSISIPGLGTVGVLPKMDFGLELLYGNKTSEEVTREPAVEESNDIRIRGSIKHRF